MSLIREYNSQIEEELDLIRSLRVLQDFSVELLPLQGIPRKNHVFIEKLNLFIFVIHLTFISVRKCKDKMKLIESCLEAKPDAYRFIHELINLAVALRIYGDYEKLKGEVIVSLIGLLKNVLN